MSNTVRLKNVSPLGHLDVPEIGRQGPAPHYGFCQSCADDPTSEHEHEAIEADELAGPGQGCLEPGEIFEVPVDVGKRLLEQKENFVLTDKPAKKTTAKGGESA